MQDAINVFLCPQRVISNKDYIAPQGWKEEPEYVEHAGWQGGYSFRHFWGNVHEILRPLSDVEGVQQLAHQYYLQNGSLGALDTARRIRLFLGEHDSA
jgi:hypothetical protein